jgi:hypothetical protein
MVFLKFTLKKTIINLYTFFILIINMINNFLFLNLDYIFSNELEK